MPIGPPATPPTRAARRVGAHAARPASTLLDPAAPAPRSRPVVVASVVVSALLIAAADALGSRAAVSAVVTLCAVLLAVAWPVLTGARTRRGTGAVLVVTTLALTAALMWRESEPLLDNVPVALSIGVVAMCLHPLVQASARTDLTVTLATTATGIAILTAGTVLASLADHPAAPLLVAMVAVAVASLTDLLTERPGRSTWMIPCAMVVGGIAALATVAVRVGEVEWWAALVGVVAAGVALCLRRVLFQQHQVDEVLGGIACGVASVLFVGPVVHVLSRAFVG